MSPSVGCRFYGFGHSCLKREPKELQSMFTDADTNSCVIALKQRAQLKNQKTISDLPDVFLGISGHLIRPLRNLNPGVA